MNIWHLTTDAPRRPTRVSVGETVTLHIGTWPIEIGQSVWVEYQSINRDGTSSNDMVKGNWKYNAPPNSFWHVKLGPFLDGDRVTYTVHGSSLDGKVTGPSSSFIVGPKIYLALLWHQHQPIYKDINHATQSGSYCHPWVRLHSIRDYYSMAALVAEHPDIHLTINLTPSLVRQIEDYIIKGATDRALELTLKPAEKLIKSELEEVLSNFFDADWHNQIFPHPRYKELFIQRRERKPFKTQDMRDLQMWFNLCWFGKEFRDGEVKLATGEIASVRSLVQQNHNFEIKDIQAMVHEQYTIMKAVIPIHSQLQERGQIEVSTTPFYHPILPLLVDTDKATVDRPGAKHPRRFAYPQDAEAQVRMSVEFYKRYFGQPPNGMWPAEGAVSQSVIPLFARHGVRWIATDKGVLARSGRWGYDVDNPEVLCQPYVAEENGMSISIFFRDTQLSDAIGFYYHVSHSPDQAARTLLSDLKNRFVSQVTGDQDRVVCIILDGENAWGSYRDDARPFLHSVYSLLEKDNEIKTVTFSEYLSGNPDRGITPHPIESQTRVYDLFTGSWIDENASAPGVDLGTWIGEEEENKGWELLGRARDFLSKAEITEEDAPTAFEAMYMAEGSDWFWWFGEDQDSGNDDEFDDLLRMHLKNIYRNLGVEIPSELDRHIVPHAVVWTFTHQVTRIQPGDRLTVRTNCPGLLNWQVDGGEPHTGEMVPAGGVMAGVQRYHLTLGPFPHRSRELKFRFKCTHRNCEGRDVCCKQEVYIVNIV